MAERRTRRTGEERRKHRQNLMRAAAETLVELGLRDAKMDDIAERIGQSKVVLYRHFASKEDLIHLILEQEADRLLQIDSGPYQGGENRAKELLNAARENTPSFVLLTRDAKHDPIYGEHHQRVRDAIFIRLSDAFEKHGLNPIFARQSSDAIVNLVLDSTLYWLENGDPSQDDQFVKWYARGSRSLDKGWRDLLGSKGSQN